MLKVVGSLRKVEFDGDKFTKALDREMSIILRGAIKVWLDTVVRTIKSAPYTVGDSFPIQTGQAKATLQPIARYVRKALPISPAPGRPNLISQGLSKTSFDVSDDKSSPGKFEYHFEWETHVTHMLLNEFNHIARVTSSTPWKATVAGHKAATAYIRGEVRRRLKKFKITNYLRTITG